MHSCSTSIDVTATVAREGVSLIEAECTAIVDWDIDDGQLDWSIDCFRFEACGTRPDARRYYIVNRDDPLFAIIREGIDMQWLEQRLIEQAGIRLANPETQWGADYRAAVL